MNQLNGPIDYVDADERPPEHIGKYLDALYDSRKLVAAVTGCVLLIGIAYAVLAEPVYRADILIQVEENPSSTKNLFGDASSMFDVKTAASAEIEVLRSRTVVSRAVDNLALFIHASPRYVPVIGRWISDHSDGLSKPWPGGYVWGRERIDVPVFEVPSNLYERKFTVTRGTGRNYELVYGDIRLRGEIGKTLKATTSSGPLEILVQSLEGNPGATFELRRSSRLSTIEKLQKDLTIAEKGKQSDVIGATLDGTDPKRTSDILNAIGAEYVRQNVQRKSEEAEHSIHFLETQLPELKTQLETSENRFNTYRASHGTIDLSEEATSLLQRSVEAQSRRADLEQKREDLLARYTAEHPAVLSIDAQLQTAQAEIDRIANQTRGLPPLEQDVLRLQRDVQVDTDLYTSLLNTEEQLRLVKAGKVGNVRLVDTAAVPEDPIRPKRPLVIAGALLVGLFIGVGVALTRRRLFDAIDDPHEIERLTGLPVYASVPHSRHEELLTRSRRASPSKGLILAGSADADPAIESLRSFRTALEFTMHEARNRFVLITGPTPGIGKSFISLNLAAVVGASGKRVLLVDADLRKGFLHRHVGVERGPGLSELVHGTHRADEVVRMNVLPGVDFIPRGSYVPNPSEVLSHANLHVLFTRLAAGYDVVLCDAPPILPVAETIELARLAGTMFLVARQGVTGVGEIRESMRRLSQIGVEIRGVIFNGLRLRPGRYGYGYGRYRYSSYSYEPNAQD
ncbi:MAG: GNVR domain-containing protein [Paraburkholderia sp.]|uniref:GNVR domain-containing protein n=3 Tax=Burkholderiaceae TaxID=119060 RepID=UPI0010F76F0E|nr:GNVR domain-containing protein [Burkholderia sp. 4M9327F10]